MVRAAAGAQKNSVKREDSCAARLAALRKLMANEGLDGFIVPMSDEYQNEYVPASARRVEYMTGFTGSAGTAIILQDRAGFFTDSRYTLQAQTEIPENLFACFDTAVKTPLAWIGDVMKKGQKLGYDPWLHSAAGVKNLQKTAEQAGLKLDAVTANLIDKIWQDRPSAPCAPIYPHGLEFSGRESADKRRELAAQLREKSCAAAIIADPASIAWLLNIRGGDVPHTPLPLSYGILHDDGHCDWFVDSRKLTPELAAHLGKEVRISQDKDFMAALDRLGAKQAAILVDAHACAEAIAARLKQAKTTLTYGDDPCALPRACKNEIERQGMRAAHRRDGAALAAFFAWLGAQPPDSVTELQAETKLEQCRAAQNLYRGPSFATIAGSGPHGAIVHYRATPDSDRLLQTGELFLLDSGGQYLDGTTDVTRTIAIGQPTEEMRTRYTLVVKGHIALATARFPAGTTGAELDVLARQYLWAAGLDYGHGTGHGVGSYLGVHEGPQNISRRSRGAVALQPGMVLSNEPGYYKTGAYGIRFENLMLVTEAEPLKDGEQPMLGFEILTLAPLDRSLLKPELLTPAEITWIHDYHERVKKELKPLVMAEAQPWLAGNTLLFN